MTTPTPSGASRRGLALTLTLILALMVVLGAIGGVCIDQGRSVAASVSAQADQAMRLRGAALAAERALNLGRSGDGAAAGKALDETVGLVKAAAEHETYEPRQKRIRAVSPVVDAVRAAVANRDEAAMASAGNSLSAALADLDRRQAKDLLEAEVQAPVAVMQTTSLYVTVMLAVIGFSVVMAGLAFRSARAGLPARQ